MATAVELVPQLAPFTRDWEQFSPNAYKDGTQTSIGYGTRAQPGETSITQDEAERRMQAELTAAAQYVDAIPGIDRMPDDVKKALTDQAYNAGGFGSGLRAAIASGSTQDVTSWMDKYRGTSQPGTEQGVSNRVDARVQLANGTYNGREGATPTNAVSMAMANPPRPNLRPDQNAPLLYGNDRPSGGTPQGWATTPTLASYSPSPSLLGFNGAPYPNPSPPPSSTGGSNSATPQPQQAPSWLPSSLQPGGPGYADNLGGGMSPLHQYSVYENSDVAAGPYGADALVKAAISGDTAAFNKALGDLTGAAAKDALTPQFLGGIGMQGVQQKLQDYFDQLQQTSPGAIRQMQSAYNSNPALQKAVPPQLQGAVTSAFSSLPPQATGQVPMPNLRPTTIPPTTTPTSPLGPTMVSYPPQGPAAFTPPDAQYADYWKGKTFNSANAPGFDPSKPTAYRDQFGEWSVPDRNNASGQFSPDQLQTMFSGLPPKDNASDPRFPPGWSPGQPLPPDAGDAGSWPDNAATNFTQPNYWTPSTLNPSQQRAMGDYSDYVAPTPMMPTQQMARDANRLAGSSVYNYPNTVTVKPPSSATPAGNALLGMGAPLPSSAFLPARPSAGTNLFTQMASLPKAPTVVPSWLPKGVTGQAAPTRTVATAPMAPPMAQPRPLTPEEAFMQRAGPAPATVNWQATLGPDPYAQPGTDDTYVLNDLGYGGGELGGPGFNAFVYG